MTHSAEYLQHLKDKHAKEPQYGRGGRTQAGFIAQLMHDFKLTSIMDYGCGKGMLIDGAIHSLAKDHGNQKRIEIFRYDPGMPQWDKLPTKGVKFELVTCTDVLEHIEPEHLLDVLFNINEYASNLVCLVIHTGMAYHALPDGRDGHLIQKPVEWWFSVLESFFDLSQPDWIGRETFRVIGMPRKFDSAAIVKARAIIADLSTEPVIEYRDPPPEFKLWGFQ